MVFAETWKKWGSKLYKLVDSSRRSVYPEGSEWVREKWEARSNERAGFYEYEKPLEDSEQESDMIWCRFSSISLAAKTISEWWCHSLKTLGGQQILERWELRILFDHSTLEVPISHLRGGVIGWCMNLGCKSKYWGNICWFNALGLGQITQGMY